MRTFSLAIHGGAGTILPAELTPERKAAYEQALHAALTAGDRILREGGTAMDAVTAAVIELEDCPLFNAGRGSVFTAEGAHEMDAAVMDGHTLAAGAVTGLQGFKNPVLAARAVMEKSEHVLLAGPGANAFAKLQGLVEETLDYFATAQRRAQWEAVMATGGLALDHSAPHTTHKDEGADRKFGTVGAVAKDARGNLAAATSTGGLTGKRYGRVGDSPVIGAGTYANEMVAISCTGWGEIYLRHLVAHRVAMLMEMAGQDLDTATRQVILSELGYTSPDSGGLIAVDAWGNISMPYNTAGMYRGLVASDTGAQVGIF